MKEGILLIQGYHQLQREFEASLEQLNPVLKREGQGKRERIAEREDRYYDYYNFIICVDFYIKKQEVEIVMGNNMKDNNSI